MPSEKEREKFLEWYWLNEGIFHQFQYDQEHVAWAAYIEGKCFALESLDEDKKRKTRAEFPEDNNA